MMDLERPAVGSGAASAGPPCASVLPSSRRGWLSVAGVCAVALVVRVAWVVATRHSYSPVTDSLQFDAIAESLVHGHGFGATFVPGMPGPSAFRGPLYPLVLAAVHAVAGDSWTMGRVEEALIGTVLVVLIGMVTSQLWSRRAGFVAMAIAAVHPTLILFGTSLQLEPLLACLLVASVAAALEHRRRPRGLRWPLVCGALIGLAVLTREIGAVAILPVMWLVWRSPAGRRSSVAPAVVLVACLAVVAPWTIRNAVRFHTFVPVSTSGGYTLAGTYNATSAADRAFPTIWREPFEDPAMARVFTRSAGSDEAVLDRRLRSASVRYAQDHPTYVARAAFWNFVGLFDLRGPAIALHTAPYVPYSTGLVRASVYASWVLDVLALAAFALPEVRAAPRAVWAVPILAVVALVVVSGSIRYRASIEPFTVMLASMTVLRALPVLRRRRGRVGGVGAAA